MFRSVTLLAVILSTAQLHATGTLYLIDGNYLYTVDTGTAVPTLIGQAYDDGLAPSGAPQSFLYCTDDNPSLYALPVDGSGQTYLAPIGDDTNRGLAFNGNTGILYGTDNSVFGSIDPGTGAVTRLATPLGETEALAADPVNNLVYGLGTGANPSLQRYQATTNNWHIVGWTTVANGGKAGLAYDPVGEVLYASDRDGSGNLYLINPATAETIVIGATGLGNTNTGLAFVPAWLFADSFETGDTSAWSNTVP